MMRARDDTSTSEGQESGYLKIGFLIFWKNMFLGKLTNFSSNMFLYKKTHQRGVLKIWHKMNESLFIWPNS